MVFCFGNQTDLRLPIQMEYYCSKEEIMKFILCFPKEKAVPSSQILKGVNNFPLQTYWSSDSKAQVSHFHRDQAGGCKRHNLSQGYSRVPEREWSKEGKSSHNQYEMKARKNQNGQ